jgi:hypothetical protein
MLEGIDPGDLSGAVMVVAGTEAADEYLHGDTEPLCDNCGRPIKYVFIAPTGHKLGGDCLATLTGDDSTRRSLVSAAKKAVGATSIRVGASSVFARFGSGASAKDKRLFNDVRLENPSWASQVPGARQRAHEELVRYAVSLADMLGIPAEGSGIMPAMKRNARARRNSASGSLLDTVEGSLSDIYRPYDMPSEDSAYLSYGNIGDKARRVDLGVIRQQPDRFLYVPSLLVFSDYSGSSVERANFKAFMREFGDTPGVWELSGGHGTNGVAIRLDAVTPEMVEVFKSLEDYPVIDEDLLGEVEMELAEESAKSYGYTDFLNAVGDSLGVTILTDADDDKATALFWETTSDLPEPYRIETGGSVYFFIDRMVEQVDLDVLDAAGIEYEED